MDQTIGQLEQDLARAEYSARTRGCYYSHAVAMARRFGKPVAAVTRDELRAFVDETMAGEGGVRRKKDCLCALLFLYRKTLGQPEMVSFIKLP